MLLERSDIEVRPGLEEAFADVMITRGLPLLTAVAGVKWARIGRGVENPTRFMILGRRLISSEPQPH